jgi:hypothetical protein
MATELVIKVSKADLIERLKKNREAHIAEYKDAIVVFREKTKAKLEEALKTVDTTVKTVMVHLSAPKAREDWYDEVIEMFGLHTDPIIEITKRQYDEYWNDKSQEITSAKASFLEYSR